MGGIFQPPPPPPPPPPLIKPDAPQWGAPPLKNEAPHLKPPPSPPLKREATFHEMIPRKSAINNNLKSN